MLSTEIKTRCFQKEKCAKLQPLTKVRSENIIDI